MAVYAAPVAACSSIGYKAPNVCLREGGAVRARGGIPGGQRVLPPLPRASCRVCTVRSRTTLWLTRWTAAGRRPSGGATVPKAALTTAHAASAYAWARRVRYPWFSPPWKASATTSAPSSHMKRSARWRRDHPVGRRRMCRTVGRSAARGCWGACVALSGGHSTGPGDSGWTA